MEFTKLLKSLSPFFPQSTFTQKSKSALKVLILSPHPDDECICSSLALRLAQENGARITNVAVTLGSNTRRQKARLKELKQACALLKMKLEVLPVDWKEKSNELQDLMVRLRPDLILAPNLKDQHPTHERTGRLLKDVLSLTPEITTLVAWTEFWGYMRKPNLLLEVPQDILLLQMEALSKHVGEIERNPFHLRLPAHMIDNVRRGSEVINGAGTSAPLFAFGQIYKLQKFNQGKFKTLKPTTWDSNEDLALRLRSLN